ISEGIYEELALHKDHHTRWYNGDSTIGHRLYKEITKVEIVKMKGKGSLTQPTNSYQWETLATNLEEFQQISVTYGDLEYHGGGFLQTNRFTN
ncbi:hypothetical protein GIB67_015006, partial [Kingdonia uniflora]